jgi:uncharacterized membrane protein YfcA
VERLLIFAFVGFVAQLIDGALGMAYGVTATSLLLSTGTSAAAASASVHLAKIGTGLASGLSHWRFGNINWRVMAWIGVPGAIGGAAGAVLLGSSDGEWMQPIVSAVLLGLGAYIMCRFAFGITRRPAPESSIRVRNLTPVGLFGGFVDAIGGGGWGPVATPSLMTIARMEPRRAIGTVSAAEMLVAIAVTLGFLFTLGSKGIDYGLTAALLLGGVAAAPLAAWLVHHLPAPITGTLVACLILVTNTRIILLWAGVPGPVRLGSLLAVLAACLAVAAWTTRKVLRERAVVASGPGLPAPVDPLLEVGALGADGGAVAVAGQHDGLGRQGEQAGVEGLDDGGEVAAGELGGAGPAREERVAAEEHR